MCSESDHCGAFAWPRANRRAWLTYRASSTTTTSRGHHTTNAVAYSAKAARITRRCPIAPKVARFALVAARSSKYSVRQQVELPRLIRRHEVDLFHSPHYVVPVRSRVPVVVTVHDLVHLRRDLRPGVSHWLASVYARALIGRAV